MMKKISICIITIFVFAGCNDENAFDCVKTVGELATYEVDVPEFNKVEIFGDIEIIIENSTEQRVSISTGENLFPKIDFEVVNGKLTVKDNNRCNWVRSYRNTTLYLSTNNLVELKNSGGRDVKTEGTYTIADELLLFSQGTAGDYYLDVNQGYLRISSNESSNFIVTGNLDRLQVGIFSGESRFDGSQLSVSKTEVFHRGSNDITLSPSGLLFGSIEAFGNIILLNKPDSIDIKFNGPGQIIEKY